MDSASPTQSRKSRRTVLLSLAGVVPFLSACGGASATQVSATLVAANTGASVAATPAAPLASATTASVGVQRAATSAVGKAVSVAGSAIILSFWGPFASTGADTTTYTAMQQVIKDFRAQQPGIGVQLTQVQYTNQTAQKLLSAIAAGQPPDVYYADRFLTATWAYKGIYSDVTPYNAKAGVSADQYLSFAWNEATWQGKQWGLPFETDSRMLYLNRDTIQQQGLDPDQPPQTTDELLTWTDKLTQVDTAQGLQRVGFWPAYAQAFHEGWIKDFGGSFFDEQNNTCTADDGKCVDAFTYMQTYAKRWGTLDRFNAFVKTLPQTPAGIGPLLSGKIAIVVLTDNGLIQIKQGAPQLNFSLAPIPGPTGPGAPMAGGFALTIPAGGKQIADAYTFIRYAAGPVGMRTYCMLHGNIPVLKAVVADPVFRADPHHAQFMDQLPRAWNRPVTIEAQLLWNEMGTAQSDVMNLKADPKTALGAVRQKVNAQLQLDAQHPAG